MTKKKKRRHPALTIDSGTTKVTAKSTKARKLSGLPMVIDGEPVRQAARRAHETNRSVIASSPEQSGCSRIGIAATRNGSE
jgi:hypothetical protein